MRFLASLTLLSSLAMAERVPVLSEPRTAPESGRLLSLNAWGDTLVGGRWGRLDVYRRDGDQVFHLDSIISDSIESEMPRILHGNSTFGLVNAVVTRSRVMDVGSGWWHKMTGWTIRTDWFSKTIDLGYGKAEGDVFSEVSPRADGQYLCSPKAGYFHRSEFGAGFPVGVVDSVVDSLRLGGDTVQVCSVDPVVRQVVRIQYSQQGTGPATVYRGNARNGFTQMSQDTLTMKPDAVFAAWDGTWLAYERSTGTVVRGGLGVNRQSYSIPSLKLSPNYTAKPVRKDSLVIFAADSSLVLAKWTRDQFKVTNIIKLDGRIGNDIAIGFSTVWVSLYGANQTSVVSFQLAWEERGSSATSVRQEIAPLQIRSISGGAALTHDGAPLTATFLEPSGRVVGQQLLGTGTTQWMAPHPGLFLVHTTLGTTRIMVK
jgi:hypothetical protein